MKAAIVSLISVFVVMIHFGGSNWKAVVGVNRVTRMLYIVSFEIWQRRKHEQIESPANQLPLIVAYYLYCLHHSGYVEDEVKYSVPVE